MANIWSRNVKSYLEFEATPGSLPAGGPDKHPTDWGFKLMPRISKSEIRAVGNLYPSGFQSGLEWVDVEAVGGAGASPAVSFQSINYVLEMLCGTATPSERGTGAWERTYNIGGTPRSASLDYGDPNIHVIRALYGFLKSMSLSFTLNTATFGAAGFARTIAEGVTPAVSPADIARKQVNPFKAGVYLSDTYAGLGDFDNPTGGALELNCVGFNIETGDLSDVFAPILPTNTSWQEPKPLSATGRANVIISAEDAAWDYLTQIRGDSIIYGRYNIIDAELISSGQPYRFAIDFVGVTPEHFSIDDQDGLHALTLPLALIQNTTLTGIRFHNVCEIETL